MQAFRTVLNNKIENFVNFPVFSGGFTKFVNQNYFKATLFLLNFYKPTLGSCELSQKNGSYKVQSFEEDKYINILYR